MQLQNYVLGSWITGDGQGTELYNAVNGNLIATASTKGLDYAQITNYAREVGNTNLRKLTFHERGRMLKAVAFHLQEHLPKFYNVSYQTGATKADSWVDIEGGIGNLFANASLRRKFPDESFCIDGESHNLSKGNTFFGNKQVRTHKSIAFAKVVAFAIYTKTFIRKLSTQACIGK